MPKKPTKNKGGRPSKNSTKRTVVKLTSKQAKFIDEYMIDLNATQAAIRAGYSKKTAKVIAAQNLSKLYIAEEIKKRQAKISEKLQVTQERVISEYAKIAFVDPAELFDDENNLIPIKQLPPEVSAAIGGLDQVIRKYGKGNNETEEHTKKIKLIDKKGALDSLARHLGLFEKDNNQKTDPIARVLAEVAKRGQSLIKGDA